MWKPERKLTTCKTREDDYKMDLEEIGWEGVDWMHLIRDGDAWEIL
jgi:hypothetical protein